MIDPPRPPPGSLLRLEPIPWIVPGGRHRTRGLPPVRLPILALLLAVLWLLMSGHYDALLLGLGAASVVLVVWLARRMGVVDHEGVPLHQLPSAPLYALWLAKEIVRSNLAVARRVLGPKVKIEPQVMRVEGVESDDVGRMLYANSITLTPGTVTVDVGDKEMLVHALTEDSAEGLRSGEMRTRVQRVAEGGS